MMVIEDQQLKKSPSRTGTPNISTSSSPKGAFSQRQQDVEQRRISLSRTGSTIISQGSHAEGAFPASPVAGNAKDEASQRKTERKLRKAEVLVKRLLAELEDQQKTTGKELRESKRREAVLQHQKAELELQATLRESDAWAKVTNLPNVLEYQQFDVQQLKPEDDVYRLFAALFTGSVVEHRPSPTSTTVCPAPLLRLRRIEVVISPKLVSRYYTARQEVRKLRQIGCGALPSLAHAKLPSRTCSAPETAELNEHFLFYGGADHLIESVCRKGFEAKRGGEGGEMQFGTACHFQVNASKADTYWNKQPSASRPTSPGKTRVRRIIMARVILGEAEKAMGPRSAATRAVGPDGAQLDSVLADSHANGGILDHAQAVVYSEDQAYPEAIISYTHDPKCACTECRASSS